MAVSLFIASRFLQILVTVAEVFNELKRKFTVAVFHGTFHCDCGQYDLFVMDLALLGFLVIILLQI